jgi:aldose 1-epimerase
MPTEVRSAGRDGVEIFSLSASGGASAEIAPAWGNNLISFRASDPVLEEVAFEKLRRQPTASGAPILFPFPNRVRDGELRYLGKRYPVSPPRHGLVRDKAWQVVATGASEADGAWVHSAIEAATFPREILGQFPFPFRLDVTYRLRGPAITMETAVANSGSEPLPFGLGIHPYFVKPEGGTLQVPARETWELSESLPTGARLPVDGRSDLREARDVAALELDDVYTGISAGADGGTRCVLRDPAGRREIVVGFDVTDFPEVVVYTPPAPRAAICVEPYTCPTDVFTLADRGIDAHLQTLAPGAVRKYTIRIEVCSID